MCQNITAQISTGEQLNCVNHKLAMIELSVTKLVEVAINDKKTKYEHTENPPPHTHTHRVYHSST